MNNKECFCGEPKKKEQIVCDECHKIRSSGKNYPEYLIQKLRE